MLYDADDLKLMEHTFKSHKQTVAHSINKYISLGLNEFSDAQEFSEGVDDVYMLGYTNGVADGAGQTGNISYTYHTHGDGYCVMDKPIYHVHAGSPTAGGACYQYKRTCGARVLNDCEDSDGNGGYIFTGDNYYCTNGHGFGGWNPGGSCPAVVGYYLSCTTSTTIPIGYECSLLNGQILYATIVYN